jgi:signal transduction histidine kinase
MQVEVEDTGIGIPKDKYQTLFKEFSKIENLDSRNPNGIGLGLYICKRVTESCGGKIWISESNLKQDNSLKHGTTFAFTMPFE